MKKRVELGYGNTSIEIELAGNYQILQSSIMEQEINWQEKVFNAFSRPIASPTLAGIVEEEKPEKIVIIVNDLTRPVPYELVLVPMLEELHAAGIKREQITLLIATGMHRPMTAEEVASSLGEEVARAYRWVNHDCDGEQAYYGELSEGVPLYVNPLVAEADLLCAVGLIAPHYMAGYSGGRKSLLPGVCGRETIEKHHSLMRREGSTTASLAENDFHKVMVEAAERCRLRFIANVVVDSRNEPIDLVAGHWLKAWEEGVRLCEQGSLVPIDKLADLVIVSPGGFPKDINMYQAQKALENASYCTKEGGKILLIAECREGLGEAVFEEWLLEAREPRDLEERIKKEFVLGGHKAYAIARVAVNHSLFLYSSLDVESTARCFMTPVEDIEGFLAENIKEDDLVYVLPHGANTVPIFRN
ncbi:MAG: nickel-dependent lactate racemase [Halanaerobiales bacterium]|jgi:nickel-dependent lactate racemase